MKTSRGAPALLAILAWAGCESAPPPPPAEHSQEWVLDKADKAAAQELQRFNQTPQAAKLGGPFLPADYDRTLKGSVVGGSAVYMVEYKYKKPVNFFTHPQHFSVWVYVDSGQVQVFPGR